ncbi:HEPN domain-containing protein [bacterium]|nr:MAG: HEPN domain-containing protein [bacterium]MCL4232698.1 HEPN domain-containing protein [Dehalococcoidia bacterium]
MKAALVLMDIDPPKTHSLDALRDTLPGGWAIQSEFSDLAWLSEWNASGRYPGDWPEARHDDAEHAIGVADAVIASVRGDLARRNVLPS